MPKETASRWSDARYTNLEVPSYVPPEALTLESGRFMHALLLRVLANDMQRLITTQAAGQYFANIPVEPEYDANGDRTNTPMNMLGDRRRQVLEELLRYLSTAEQTKPKELVIRRYFTQEQMDSGAWGAILGARGSVHQQLEKELHCKIVLVGRGITNPLKDTSPNAATMALEDPHVRISAANEGDMQKAVERIEWILSDDPEAEEFREKNRRRMAQVEGRYDPRTWVSGADKKAAGADSSKGGKRAREEALVQEAVDNEVDEFLDGL